MLSALCRRTALATAPSMHAARASMSWDSRRLPAGGGLAGGAVTALPPSVRSAASAELEPEAPPPPPPAPLPLQLPLPLARARWSRSNDDDDDEARRSSEAPAASWALSPAAAACRRRLRAASVLAIVTCSCRLRTPSSRSAPSPSLTREGVASMASSRCSTAAVEMAARWLARETSVSALPRSAADSSSRPSSPSRLRSRATARSRELVLLRRSEATAGALLLSSCRSLSSTVLSVPDAVALVIRSISRLLAAASSTANRRFAERSRRARAPDSA